MIRILVRHGQVEIGRLLRAIGPLIRKYPQMSRKFTVHALKIYDA